MTVRVQVSTMRETPEDLRREKEIFEAWLSLRCNDSNRLFEATKIDNSHDEHAKYRAVLDFILYEIITGQQKKAVALIECKTANPHRYCKYGATLNEPKYSTAVNMSLDYNIPAILLTLYGGNIYEWVMKAPYKIPLSIQHDIRPSFIWSKGRKNVHNYDDNEPALYMPWNLAKCYTFRSETAVQSATPFGKPDPLASWERYKGYDGLDSLSH